MRTAYYDKVQERAAAGAMAPLLDGFLARLDERGYSRTSRRVYHLGAIHVGAWCRRVHIEIADLDEAALGRFERHLSRCACRVLRPGSAEQSAGDPRAAKHVLDYLRSRGIVEPAPEERRSPLVAEFLGWLRQRGLADTTVAARLRWIAPALRALGTATRRWRPVDIRRFVARRSKRLSTAMTRHLVDALRSLLGFLVVHGRCDRRVLDALPRFAGWRQATLPRYLDDDAIERAIATASSRSPIGIRDRAILLLLARLGLRAGEVGRLQLGDVDLPGRRIRVVGSKSGEIAWLPLPKDVWGALRRWLKTARPSTRDDHVFVRAKAPFVGATRPTMITHVAARALDRAGIETPIKGAHVFRHSLATRLLRRGWSLDAIGALLRHRCRETTMIYAKVDLGALESAVQPWPADA